MQQSFLWVEILVFTGAVICVDGHCSFHWCGRLFWWKVQSSLMLVVVFTEGIVVTACSTEIPKYLVRPVIRVAESAVQL